MAAQNDGLGSHILVPVLPQLHYMFLLITGFTGHFIQYIHFDVLVSMELQRCGHLQAR